VCEGGSRCILRRTRDGGPAWAWEKTHAESRQGPVGKEGDHKGSKVLTGKAPQTDIGVLVCVLSEEYTYVYVYRSCWEMCVFLSMCIGVERKEEDMKDEGEREKERGRREGEGKRKEGFIYLICQQTL
jgi:hypothetical protein